MFLEERLLQQASEGDRNAFAALYTHYSPLLYRLLYQLTGQSKQNTEEIIQEVFLSIWEKKEALVMVKSFRAFVFRVARNKMIDLHRKSQTQLRHTELYSGLHAHHTGELFNDILFVEYKAAVSRAIAGSSCSTPP